MPRINLLPWRDTLRKEREQRFLAILGAALGITALVFGGIHLYIAGLIGNQEARNKLLTTEIKKAEEQIKEIEDLDEKKVNLIKRMETIQILEENRPLVVHLFDELVRKVPDGVYFTNMKQEGAKVTLQGIAQSDARVSSLMTNLDSSEWLTSPLIHIIEKKEEKGTSSTTKKTTRSFSEFRLEVRQILPQGTEEEIPEEKSKKPATAPAAADKKK